jgi:hypothetical protein
MLLYFVCVLKSNHTNAFSLVVIVVLVLFEVPVVRGGADLLATVQFFVWWRTLMSVSSLHSNAIDGRTEFLVLKLRQFLVAERFALARAHQTSCLLFTIFWFNTWIGDGAFSWVAVISRYVTTRIHWFSA